MSFFVCLRPESTWEAIGAVEGWIFSARFSAPKAENTAQPLPASAGNGCGIPPLAGTSGILLPLQKGLRKQGIGANWQVTMVPFRRVCVCLSAVIGVQVHLFDLLHQRIPGIGAGALVVEGLLHHFVQTAQEGLFGNTVMPIKLPDAKIRHTGSPRSRI